MVRSGCVSSISRASAPAITSPDGVTDTTLGTIPDRIRGPVSSITATRLLVVPRSIPTIFDSVFPKSISNVDIQFLFNIPDQVRNVSPAVQRTSHRLQQRSVLGRVVLGEQRRQSVIDVLPQPGKPLPRLDQLRARGFVAAAQFLQRHIQLKNLFEQLR